MPTAIEFNHVSKQYRLGLVSTKTLSHDLDRWWKMNILGKEDPYLKIGDINDRATKGESDYVWALKDIDFKVEQGDVVGIIGKNGAGKSTLLKLLSKVTGPTTGSIRAKGRIGALLEVGTGFHPEMTGRENIFLNGAILGMTKQEIASKLDEIVDFSGCERYLDTPVKRYSSGMMVRLGFAVAAHLDPEILVVDEVLAVGDAEFQKKAIGKMQDVSKGEGRTVLFVSHNMDSMLSLCTHGILLDSGQILYESDIKSTIGEYLSNGNNNCSFIQERPNKPIQISKFDFLGNKENRKGIFNLSDQIGCELSILCNRQVDKKAVISIIIFTISRRKLCTTEIPIGGTSGEVKFELIYHGGVLMPGKYYFVAVIHIPNVEVIDSQEVGAFTIQDSYSEFLKYPGVDNGLFIYKPNIMVEKNH